MSPLLEEKLDNSHEQLDILPFASLAESDELHEGFLIGGPDSDSSEKRSPTERFNAVTMALRLSTEGLLADEVRRELACLHQFQVAQGSAGRAGIECTLSRGT